VTVDLDLLRQGNRRALAKAITVVESTLESDRVKSQQILESILPQTGNSIRVGISGVPGVGKSTFIDALGLYLISLGKKVAVLAVDPSSPMAGGSILGDKTRMEELSRAENAYIRPSPSSGALGGVAQKTRESMLLCEAAGYDIILVETVGVGQSEFEVAAMVDFFLVLMVPNAGDELQGIKKGIMELVDGLVINKADGESINLAKISMSHYKSAFHLLKNSGFWSPRVLSCSALEETNLDTVWAMIAEYTATATGNGFFVSNREKQNIDWMNKLIHELLEQSLYENKLVAEIMPSLKESVTKGAMTPYNAAKKVISLI
jgi:LAO/AO transport system kinase